MTAEADDGAGMAILSRYPDPDAVVITDPLSNPETLAVYVPKCSKALPLANANARGCV